MMHVLLQRSLISILVGGLMIVGVLRGQAQSGITAPGTILADRYSRLDRFARELPDRRTWTVVTLAATLAGAAHSDTDKARLIFTWLTCHISYDVAYLRGDRRRNYAPADVLAQRRSICQGYADLFTALARQMRLPARTVIGYARTAPGDRPTDPQETNHAWNVYRANSRWHLLDATWGAGGVDDAAIFSHEFKPWYFDTTPAAFLFSHWPRDARWQLLLTPQPWTAFADWPYASPLLFRRGASGEALQQTLARRQAPTPTLPTAYDCPLPAQLEQIPLTAELEPGRPVLFRFEVPAGTVVGIENGGRIQILPEVGAFREGYVNPRPGRLQVLLWQSGINLRYTLLNYRVPSVLPLRLHRKRWPDTANVAYLLRYRTQLAEPVAAKP